MRFVQEEAKKPWLRREENGTKQTDVGESASPQGCGSFSLSDPDPLPTPVRVCLSHKHTTVKNPACSPCSMELDQGNHPSFASLLFEAQSYGGQTVIHACVITRPPNTDSLPKDGALE